MKKLGEALAARPRLRRIDRNDAAGPATLPRDASDAGRAPAEPPVCPICQGAGWLRAGVPVGHPSFGRLFQCECLLAQLDARRTAELRRYSALEAFADKTFESFDAKVPGVDRAYEAARRFARDPKDWLILVGGFGCGKTHLAAAIANEAVRRGNPALFSVVPDLLDHLRSAFSPSSELQYDELFERVRSAGLLILDDLGTESATPWAREKLYQIVNYRYNLRQPTVITTNRQLRDIDDRVRSRMTDASFCTVLEISADDYRQLRPGERRRVGPTRLRG